MPPSEHVLIDALQFRGARILFSSDNGDGKGAVWLVYRDVRPSHARMMVLMEHMCLGLADDAPLNSPGVRPMVEGDL